MTYGSQIAVFGYADRKTEEPPSCFRGELMPAQPSNKDVLRYHISELQRIRYANTSYKMAIKKASVYFGSETITQNSS